MAFGSDLSKNSKIFVAGHNGLVGSAIVRCLERHGFTHILKQTRLELDLKETDRVRHFFETEKPEYVILAAAKVGGIGANSTYPVEFLLENLRIQNNVISCSAEFGVRKLVFLGSSCIYPKNARYPLTEDQFLTGAFEPTNEAYALAKSVGIKLCEFYHKQYGKNFISLMPTNLYGPNDYYHLENSHVIPAVMLKVLKAKKENKKSVKLWGTGKPYREFLHSDDLAEAILLCLQKYNEPELINIGSGQEITIEELSRKIIQVCGYTGTIEWDDSKPDGIVRKIMDSNKIRKLGWNPKISLEIGLKSIVEEAAKELS
jgi:GDP-L-fucose synthase